MSTPTVSVSQITLEIINMSTEEIKRYTPVDFKKITVTFPVGILEITPGFSGFITDNSYGVNLQSGICTMFFNDGKEERYNFVNGWLNIYNIISPEMTQTEYRMSLKVYCE